MDPAKSQAPTVDLQRRKAFLPSYTPLSVIALGQTRGVGFFRVCQSPISFPFVTSSIERWRDGVLPLQMPKEVLAMLWQTVIASWKRLEPASRAPCTFSSRKELFSPIGCWRQTLSWKGLGRQNGVIYRVAENESQG